MGNSAPAELSPNNESDLKKKWISDIKEVKDEASFLGASLEEWRASELDDAADDRQDGRRDVGEA